MNQEEYNPFEEPPEDRDQAATDAAQDADRNGPNEESAEAEHTPAELRQESQQDGEEAEAEDATRELAQMKEAMLRLKAEMDNREKRLEREMVKTRKFALESLMRDLVQVLDSMDQAISAGETAAGENAPEGMELVRKQALQVLASHGLEALVPEGEKFDPTWHEAMATQPSDEHDSDTIVRVLQKGYRLNDRLIRPARVIVASSD